MVLLHLLQPLQPPPPYEEVQNDIDAESLWPETIPWPLGSGLQVPENPTCCFCGAQHPLECWPAGWKCVVVTGRFSWIGVHTLRTRPHALFTIPVDNEPPMRVGPRITAPQIQVVFMCMRQPCLTRIERISYSQINVHERILNLLGSAD